MTSIDHVLFDLGGVLVDFRGISSLAQRLDRPLEVMAETWLASPSVRAYERGQIDTASFMDRIQAEMQLGLSAQALKSEMEGWLPGVLPGARELIGDLATTNVIVSCLSNTNALHWRRMTSWGVNRWFQHRLLSHEIGLVKPDAAIFEHACRVLDAEPRSVLYFDDHPTNVTAAAEGGLRAVQVDGPGAARAELVAAGILRA